MSADDRARWDARYAAGEHPPGPPEPFVQEILQTLPPGARVLDVAGGLGRHALPAARAGAAVTLVDVSPAGLARATAAAAAEGLALTPVAADLDAPEALPEGPFDLVVVTWFLLPEAAWAALPRRLAPGGRLVYVQPTLQNQARHAHPSARFCVAPGALSARAVSAGLTVLRAEEGWDALDHHTARLEARR